MSSAFHYYSIIGQKPRHLCNQKKAAVSYRLVVFIPRNAVLASQIHMYLLSLCWRTLSFASVHLATPCFPATLSLRLSGMRLGLFP